MLLGTEHNFTLESFFRFLNKILEVRTGRHNNQEILNYYSKATNKPETSSVYVYEYPIMDYYIFKIHPLMLQHILMTFP